MGTAHRRTGASMSEDLSLEDRVAALERRELARADSAQSRSSTVSMVASQLSTSVKESDGVWVIDPEACERTVERYSPELMNGTPPARRRHVALRVFYEAAEEAGLSVRTETVGTETVGIARVLVFWQSQQQGPA